MSQCDRGSVSDVLVPEIWNENEDLWRDLVDQREPVSPVPDEAEDLKSVLLENANLEEEMCKRLLVCLFHSFAQPQPW